MKFMRLRFCRFEMVGGVRRKRAGVEGRYLFLVPCIGGGAKEPNTKSREHLASA
jgi:hypothetical protein